MRVYQRAAILIVAVGLSSCSRSNDAEFEAAAPIAPLPTEPTHNTANESEGADQQRLRVNEALGRLAVPFEENRGQWQSEVAFKANHFAGSLWVTRQGQLVYSLLGPTVDEDETEGTSPSTPGRNALAARAANSLRPSTASTNAASTNAASANAASTNEPAAIRTPRERGPGWTLTEEFVGGHPSAPRGLSASPTNVSYFIGDDERQWAPRVATYREVTLGEVWPNIEVRLVTRTNNVEKFFHVRAGGDANRIRISLAGGSDVRLTATGGLRVTTGNGDIELSPPVAYQETDGVRHEVSVRYRLTSDGYGFIVGEYDQSKELVIDPILQSTYVGVGGTEAGVDVAVAAGGEVYVLGQTDGFGFPGVSGGYQTAPTNMTDFVISRLNATLTTLQQSTYLGGSNQDYAQRVTIDATGNVLVLGSSWSPNFPGRAGGAQPAPGGTSQYNDFVVSRLNSSLTMLLQSTYWGAGGWDFAYDFARAANGDVVVVGTVYALTNPGTFPGTAGSAQPAWGGGGRDIGVVRFNSTLTSAIRATLLGGNGDESGHGVAIDPGGDIVVVGHSNATNFPGVAGAAQAIKSSGNDIVVSRLNSNLTTLIRSTYLGGSGFENGGRVAINSVGEIIVSGTSGSANFPGAAGGAQPALANTGDFYGDMVVARFNSTLTALLQSTYLGGSSHDLGGDDTSVVHDLIVTSNNEVIVVGATASINFPATSRGAQDRLAASYDGFFSRINGSLTQFVQNTFVGGPLADQLRGVALDTSGYLVAIGSTGSGVNPDFPGVAGGARTHGGLNDIVLVRLTADLVGCASDGQCLTSTSLNVPNPAGGPVFVNRPFCNTTTMQCYLCASDSDCTGAQPYCKTATGACVACLSDANCSGRCQSNVCVPRCSSDANCNDSDPCTADSCNLGPGTCVNTTVSPGASCIGTAGVCTGGSSPTCVGCLDNTHCTGTNYCNTTLNTCGPAVLTIASPIDAFSTTNTQIPISGTATPGQAVQVVVGGQTLNTTADASGSWTVTPSAPLSAGPQTAIATLTMLGGSTPMASRSFSILCSSNNQCSGGTPYCVVGTGQCAGGSVAITAPAMSSTTADRRIPISGTATPGQVVSVVLPTGTQMVTAAADGLWSITPTSDLPLGVVSVTATIPSAGVMMPAATTMFSVLCDANNDCSSATVCDTSAGACALPLIAISSPALNSATVSRRPVIGGTATPGQAVTVSINGETLMTTSDVAGAWSVTPTADLPIGLIGTFATLLPVDGQTPTAMTTFAVQCTDNNACGVGATPYCAAGACSTGAIQILLPVNASTLGDPRPPISGTATPNQTVSVDVAGQTLTTTSDANGAWSVLPNADIANGAVTATATIEARGGMTPSSTTMFNIQMECSTNAMCSAPTPYCGAGRCASGAVTISSPTMDITTLNRRIPIVGTATAGQTVTLVIGAQTFTGTANAAGQWTIIPTGDLELGLVTATATIPSVGGQMPSASTAFTVGCTLNSECADPTPYCGASSLCSAGAIQITTPMNNASVGLLRQPILGSATPNQMVTVTVDGQTLATTSDASGLWMVVPTADLTPGGLLAVATITPLGGMTPTSMSMFMLASDCFVDTDCAGATPYCGGGRCVAGSIDITSPAMSATLENRRPTLRGTATPFHNVTVMVGSETLTVTTDAAGQWAVTPLGDLPVGPITAVATLASVGGMTPMDQLMFTIACQVNPECGGTTPYCGEAGICMAGAIAITQPANGATVGLRRPLISGTSTANQSVTVMVSGQTLTTTSSATGTWTVRPTTDLVNGPHTATATLASVGGMSPSSNIMFTVDVQCLVDTDCASTVPYCGAGICGMGRVMIVSPAAGATATGRRPMISGTATPNHVVTVLVEGQTLMTTSDDAGNWSVVPTADLAVGSASIVATLEPVSGQMPRDERMFVVPCTANGDCSGATAACNAMTRACVAPSVAVTSPADGASLTNARPVISGTATPGQTVAVFLDGAMVGTAVADATGTWTFMLSSSLTAGPHTVQGRIIIGASTTSSTTNSFTIGSGDAGVDSGTSDAGSADAGTRIDASTPLDGGDLSRGALVGGGFGCSASPNTTGSTVWAWLLALGLWTFIRRRAQR